MKGKIHISRVLLDIKDGRPFLLQFVRATGKNKGTIKTVPKAIYGVAYTKATGKPLRSKTNLHKHRSRVPLVDLEQDHPFTPFISHIIGYNGQQVMH